MNNLPQSSRDVILRTSHSDQAEEFYKNGLGFKVTHETDAMLRVETGAIRLFVEKAEPHGPAFDFLVRDVQAAKRDLLAAGCSAVEEQASVPRCYLRDPFGLVFNLGQTPSAE